MSSVIGTTRELATFCASAADFPWIAVDTEFVRERTYWPILCLVQIATPEQARAVDPLADGIDLSPLLELMSDPGVLKVFHAARQDLEIFHMLSDRIPDPVFDSQVAAMVCGYGESIGYEKLVRRVTGHAIDKTFQVADWARRPLGARQLAYALDDVIHLREIYASLSARIEAEGRSAWVAEEMALLTDPAIYRNDPELAWKRVKARVRKPLNLAILRALAAWRERRAQERDVPRNWILGDRALSEISAAAPRSVSELKALRGLGSGRFGGEQADRIVALVDGVRKTDPSSWPSVETSAEAAATGGPAVDLLKTLLRIKGEEHAVAPKLLASSADLAAIAAAGTADVPALRGWRREVFGEDALRLMRGEIAISIRGSAPVLIPAGDGPRRRRSGPRGSRGPAER